MKDIIKYNESIFELNDIEKKEYEKWYKKHKRCGQLITFHMTPTGIGTQIIVECSKCKIETDITDYESW